MTCCKYSAGMLKTRVEFQRKSTARDGSGGSVESWSSLAGAQTRGYFKALSGYERFASSRVEAQTKNRLVVRYFADVKESDRVEINGNSYNIRFINNVELSDDWLEIDLSGGVAT